MARVVGWPPQREGSFAVHGMPACAKPSERSSGELGGSGPCSRRLRWGGGPWWALPARRRPRNPARAVRASELEDYASPPTQISPIVQIYSSFAVRASRNTEISPIAHIFGNSKHHHGREPHNLSDRCDFEYLDR